MAQEDIDRLISRYKVTAKVKVGGSPKLGAATPVEEGVAGRSIPKDHPFEPKVMKPLAKSLWAASVSLGHALTAYRYFSRLKSSTISPDGLLGGRGYIMPVTEIRKNLHAACEMLSAITDTLHDEITAPHWKPRLAQLEPDEADDVEKFVEESQEILENPEEEVEEEVEEIEDSDKEEKTSTRDKTANSSLPVETLSGPRIIHLDRGEEDPNPSDSYPDDGWGQPIEKQYLYPSPFVASSRVPNAETEDTPTEGFDFGLGYGAKGQGAGGYANPSGEGKNKGVWGPQSGLPGSGTTSVGDNSSDFEFKQHYFATAQLPNDLEPPVARSDYYTGDRGNLVNTQSILPGEGSPMVEKTLDLSNPGSKSQDVETPYVRWEDSIHDYRRDPLYNWPQKIEQQD